MLDLLELRLKQKRPKKSLCSLPACLLITAVGSGGEKMTALARISFSAVSHTHETMLA